MKTSWTFTDSVTSTTYVFEVNPKEGGAPERKKHVASKPTLAPGGNVLVNQGTNYPNEYEWSGTIMNQAQHDMFVIWWDKRHQIQLTDDLGRSSFVYITEYTPQRERASRSPYKRSYTMKAVALDWA